MRGKSMRQPTFFMAFDYDYTGNPALLDCRKVAFFASRVVSPTVEEQVLRWAEPCCATDRVVISGFQSPLEKSVFERPAAPAPSDSSPLETGVLAPQTSRIAATTKSACRACA